ncbi:MAG: hypothetical protein M3N93_07025 [Acidobacteriota bacterium]|nr:hypothetical protein [Acidobacteriota bacterium]
MKLHRPSRRDFLVSLASAVPAARLSAQKTAKEKETAKEKGRRLAEKVLAGLGGGAFRDMQTRTEIGRAYSFYREQLTGLSIAQIYTRYDTRHDGPAEDGALRQRQRQVFGRKQEDAVIFTGTEGFDVTWRGAKPLTDERVKQFRETTLHDVFYIFRARYAEPGIEFEDAGADTIENQAVRALDIFDAENRRLRVWVGAVGYLPVKQRFRRWDPSINDWREEVARYSKYRDVGQGVMWPFATTRERDTEKIHEMYCERVTLNDALPESLFELPNGIRILKK